jgi:cation diffusion facilitator family transporter
MTSTKAGYIEGTVSIVGNAALFTLKLWASIITGSIALAADAWHTLSDSLTSIVVVVAAKLSSKKADKEHPFGHGRWEQIAALFIAVFLGIIAFEFLRSSVIRFNSREKVEFGMIAIIVTIFSIVVKEGMAQFAFYIGKKSGNSSVSADGWHHRSDALTSVVVLIGILFAKQFWWIDSVLGFFSALVLFYVTFVILKESINKMLGEEPSKELIDSVTKEIVNYYEDDMQLHHLHLHNYVSHKELTMHIRLNKDLSIENGHEIASSIERLVKDKFNIIATVHVEPLLYRTPRRGPSETDD